MIPPSFKPDGPLNHPRMRVIRVSDRNDPAIFLGHVIIERSEEAQHAPDGSLFSASLTLAFQQIEQDMSALGGQHGDFRAHYCAINNTISLTGDALFMDLEKLKGHRVGTYLFHLIVEWAMQWPHATVNSIRLSSLQGYNRARRNRLYERAGLEFIYNDQEGNSGHSKAMLAGNLIVVESWRQNIKELSMQDFLSAYRRMEIDLQHSIAARKNLTAELRQVHSKRLQWGADTAKRYAVIAITVFLLALSFLAQFT